ncbi:MAG: IS3 family transposase [Anaerolineae bacterium]
MSRFIIYCENVSLLDAQTLDELHAVVSDRMAYYNNERRHSRTEYLAPLRYVEMLQSGP